MWKLWYFKKKIFCFFLVRVPPFRKNPYRIFGFLSQKIKIAHIRLFLNFKSKFAINYLQNKHYKSYFRMNLTILCQFWVSIPDRTNLSIFDHTFKCPHEVLWLSKSNILIFPNRRRFGLSKINFLFFIWPLVWEESSSEFVQLS